MAQKVITEFIDDIDGSVAERTFRFSVDGTDYAIDLSTDNIAEFKSAVGGFIESARKVSNTTRGATRSTGTAPRANREHLAAVREWARGQGMPVSSRGRVSADIMARFEQAHQGSQLAAVG